MSKLRVVIAAAAATAIIGAAASMGGAGAASAPGVGTGSAATSLVEVALGSNGSVLSVRLMGDESKSLTDTKAGTPSAFTRLARLNVTSTAVPALNASLPGVEARAPGGTPSITTPAESLNTPASTGTISPATLTASFDSTGAKSGLNTQVSNLSLVGGLLNVPNATSSLSTDAIGANSDGVRGVKIDQITVLDLGALLKFLGIDLSALPVSVLNNLLGSLGLSLPGLASGVDLQGAVTQLQAAIDQVSSLVDSATGNTVGSTISDQVGSIIGDLGSTVGNLGLLSHSRRFAAAITIPTADSPISTLTNTLNQLKGTLSGLLGNALSALDNVSLLSADGIEAGIQTKAADTVANSVAAITAKIGSLSVGAKAIPGVDLGAAAATVSNLVNTVTGTLNQVLSGVNPGLANIVSLKVLDQSKNVSASGGYTHAVAGLTALTATVQAPANLAAIVSTVTAPANSVATLVGSLGGNLPALAPTAAALQGAIGSVSALAGGATIKVADLTSAADFAPGTTPAGTPTASGAPGAPASSGELPRTGQDTAPLAVFGILALAMSLAIVRWLRRPITND